ncbi:MAG: endonuclease III domain-containing protein [Elusimicrobiota bacterium]
MRPIEPSAAYRLLLRSYGPRGWWPTTPPHGLRPKYHPGRYAPPSPKASLEICLGAILTQNTAWLNVERALESLNRAGALDVHRLRRIPSRRLQSLIRSSGYFVQKSIKLKKFAEHVLDKGRPLHLWLRGGSLPDLREELLGIHGVGPETADSMLLYAGGRPSFVVDAYTKRIGSRVGWYSKNAGYDDVQKFLALRLRREAKVFNEFHALIVELAKRHCKTKPDCAQCPLRGGCRTGREL